MNKTHGHTVGKKRSPEWIAWMNMTQRCSLTSKRHDRGRYVGRGITVCERWKSSEAFISDMGKRPAGTSLDRIDNSKGYEPGNCEWRTPTAQARNRRSTVHLTLSGATHTMSEWAEITGIPYNTIKTRKRAGLSVQDILNNH